MSAISKVLREAGRDEYRMLMFWCRGCNEAHGVSVSRPPGQPGPVWGYNGNPDRPTFTPSILVTGKRFTEKGEADLEAWRAAGCPSRNGVPFDSAPMVCHSFVTDGRIQFLGDCTHALAGQTVDLPSFHEEIDA